MNVCDQGPECFYLKNFLGTGCVFNTVALMYNSPV
jgi:hypothetical protein